MRGWCVAALRAIVVRTLQCILRYRTVTILEMRWVEMYYRIVILLENSDSDNRARSDNRYLILSRRYRVARPKYLPERANKQPRAIH